MVADVFHRQRWLPPPPRQVQVILQEAGVVARNKSCRVKKYTTKLGVFCGPMTMILLLIAILLFHSSPKATSTTEAAEVDSPPLPLVGEKVATGSEMISEQDATSGKQRLFRWTRYASPDEDDSNMMPSRRNNEIAATMDINSLLANSSVLTKSNETTGQSDSGIEQYILMTSFVVEIVVLIVGLIENIIVIIIILLFTKEKSVADIYIFNLAIADMTFLAGLVFLPATSINEHWAFGNIVCKMFMSLTALNQFASSLLLSLMSFDRYLAVCHPIFSQRYRRPEPAKLMCCFVWILCFLLMIPILLNSKTNERDSTCGVYWPDSGILERVFTLYSFGIGFLLPLVLIVVFYRCVVIKLRSTASGPQCGSSEQRNKNRESTNRRVTTLVKAIVLTYGLCWLPYWIGQMLIGFSQSQQAQTNVDYVPYYTLNQVAGCLSYLNSAINPVLYAFLSDTFRRRCAQFWQSILSSYLFKRWCGSGQSPPAGRGGCTKASVTENRNNHQGHSRHEKDEENLQNNNNSNNKNGAPSVTITSQTGTTTVSGGTDAV